MGSLIYKDLYIERKRYLFLGLILLGIILYEVMIIESIKYGNLSQLSIATKETILEKLFLCIHYLPICMILSGMWGEVEVVLMDYSAKWHDFMISTPVGERKRVGSKYCVLGLHLMGGLMFSGLNGWLFGKISSYQISKGVFVNWLMVMLFYTLLMVFSVTLAYYVRTKRALMLRLGVIMAGIYLVIQLGAIYVLQRGRSVSDCEADMFFIQQMKEHYIAMRNGLGPFLPLLIIAILGSGYVLSVKALSRRQ